MSSQPLEMGRRSIDVVASRFFSTAGRHSPIDQTKGSDIGTKRLIMRCEGAEEHACLGKAVQIDQTLC